MKLMLAIGTTVGALYGIATYITDIVIACS